MCAGGKPASAGPARVARGASDIDDEAAARLTSSEAPARRALGLSEREFGHPVHGIKRQLHGNPDMLFDPARADVHDRGPLEWLGNLLDELWGLTKPGLFAEFFCGFNITDPEDHRSFIRLEPGT